MQNSPNLARFSPEILADEIPAWNKVIQLGKERIWQQNSYVYQPKNHPEGFHLVTNGTFRSFIIGSNGQQRTLWLIRKNMLMGEVGMLSRSHMIYFMKCETEGKTFFFSKKIFNNCLLPEYPHVIASMMRIISNKVRMQSEDSQGWNFLPAWKRVGEFLQNAEIDSNGLIRFRHGAVAEFLGIHRVTVTKALAKLRHEGLIACFPEGTSILQPEKLRTLIENK